MRNTSYLSKILLTASLFTAYSHINAQDAIIKYYDADWAVTSKEKAVYYNEYIKEGSNYKCISYWVKTNIIQGRAVFPDTVTKKPIGVAVSYYKNGNLEDSVEYDNTGNTKDAYHYYENKQLAAHYYLPANQKEAVIEGFDENGKKIKNYVYAREAEFKGGDKAWRSYIQKNVSTDFYNVKGEGETRVTVLVQFVVDENGYAVRPKVLSSSGITAVDRDAVRVISNSPQWNNALLYNKPVKAYRIQPFTYVLTAKK